MRLDPDEVVVHCHDCGARLYNAHASEAKSDPRTDYSGGNHASRPCPHAGNNDKARKAGCR